MRPFISLFMICFAASSVYAQKQNALPTPSGKPLLTIIVDYSTESTSLVNGFEQDPELVSLRNKCTYSEISNTNPIYKESLSKIIAPSRLPAIILQDPRDGGVIYCASRDSLPPLSEIDDQVGSFWDAYLMAKSLAEPAMQQVGESPPCPDGTCPPDWNNTPPQERIVLPSLLDTIAKRPTPIRDTISGAIWILVLAVVAVFLMLMAFAVLALILVIVVNRRTPPE